MYRIGLGRIEIVSWISIGLTTEETNWSGRIEKVLTISFGFVRIDFRVDA